MAGGHVPRRFFGKQIDVVTEKCPAIPVSFFIEEECHKVDEILLVWHDYKFPDDDRKHRWWQRKHKNFYRLRTVAGRIFEIYFDLDSGSKNNDSRRWYVTKKFDCE